MTEQEQRVTHEIESVMRQVTVSVAIEGAPDLHRWSDGPGMPIRPQRLTVIYHNGKRGSVTVRGPLVTKLGKVRKDSSASQSLYRGSWPAWVAPIVERLDSLYAYTEEVPSGEAERTATG